MKRSSSNEAKRYPGRERTQRSSQPSHQNSHSLLSGTGWAPDFWGSSEQAAASSCRWLWWIPAGLDPNLGCLWPLKQEPSSGAGELPKLKLNLSTETHDYSCSVPGFYTVLSRLEHFQTRFQFWLQLTGRSSLWKAVSVSERACWLALQEAQSIEVQLHHCSLPEVFAARRHGEWPEGTSRPFMGLSGILIAGMVVVRVEPHSLEVTWGANVSLHSS